MKINVLVNGKIGVINLTHSTFIVEDLKAHVCKKMNFPKEDYKLKIDFIDNSIELVQTHSNLSFSSPTKEEKEIIYVLFDGTKYNNICTSVDVALPQKYRIDGSYLLTHHLRTLTVGHYGSEWIEFMGKAKHNDFINVYADSEENPLLLYKIRVIKRGAEKEDRKSILNPFKQIQNLENEILSKVKAEFSKADFVSIDSNYKNTRLKISVFFKDFKEGESITYFGEGEKDYNKPINPQLEKRCVAVYKILKPYLKAN